MNFRHLLLFSALTLAACNGSDSSSSQTDTGTFDTGESKNPAQDKLTADDARRKANELALSGKTIEAAEVLKTAGLPLEAGQLLAAEGHEDEAFDLLAPRDFVLDDRTIYKRGKSESITASSVDETTSAKRHSMQIGGKAIQFTARAGHLVAKGENSSKAAIFYTAYTRDGLPHEKRPVTFFWNGGPGSASIWLHLGSWGPQRLVSDAPNIPEEYQQVQPASFPLIDNAETLLDRTDLVFVDPPGTGLSSAIAPNINNDFWGVDLDAQVIAGFITAYNNRYNRQSSPKYLYGESYGGIRTPIVADILLQSGTGEFAPDPSGKPAVVLSGIILNSPILDYTHDCSLMTIRSIADAEVSCGGYLPSYAMTANYFDLPKPRNIVDKLGYLRSIEQYVNDTYVPTLARHPAPRTRPMFLPNGEPAPTTDDFAAFMASPWWAYASTKEGQDFIGDLSQITGLNAMYWRFRPNMLPSVMFTALKPDFALGRFDARMALPTASPYIADNYIDLAFTNEIASYLPNFVNYNNNTGYGVLQDEPIASWVWPHRGSPAIFSPASTTDLMEALSLEPKLKLLALHGYQDLATPGFQTELDLKALFYGLSEDGSRDLTMLNRMPVKWFEGGHMTYNTEESRAPMKQVLDEYYDSQEYPVLAPTAVSN